jgi:hypothetical protein
VINVNPEYQNFYKSKSLFSLNTKVSHCDNHKAGKCAFRFKQQEETYQLSRAPPNRLEMYTNQFNKRSNSLKQTNKKDLPPPLPSPFPSPPVSYAGGPKLRMNKTVDVQN